MKKIIIILITIPILSFSQIQITPNNANIGDSTTLWVTGNQDDFIDSLGNVVSLYLGADCNLMGYPSCGYNLTVPDLPYWTYINNDTVGFYTTLFIPRTTISPDPIPDPPTICTFPSTYTLGAFGYYPTPGDTSNISWQFNDNYPFGQAFTVNPLSGCTDICAINYDSCATVNDSSCIYDISADTVYVDICSDPLGMGGAPEYYLYGNGYPFYLNGVLYNINSNYIVITTSGVYEAVYQNYTPWGTGNGCDSIVVFDILIDDVTYSTTLETACESYFWNGSLYSSSGTYTWIGTNSKGCDSVATLELTIKTPTISNNTHTACDSYSWNGNTYTSSGTYTWIGTNSMGCDSLATLELTINRSNASDFNQLLILSETHEYPWENCGSCYLLTPSGSGGETVWELEGSSWHRIPQNPNSYQFCGYELEQMEQAGYVHDVIDTLYSIGSNIILVPGQYGAGTNYEIYCETGVNQGNNNFIPEKLQTFDIDQNSLLYYDEIDLDNYETSTYSFSNNKVYILSEENDTTHIVSIDKNGVLEKEFLSSIGNNSTEYIEIEAHNNNLYLVSTSSSNTGGEQVNFSKYNTNTKTLTHVNVLDTVDHIELEGRSTFSDFNSKMYVVYGDEGESTLISIDTLGSYQAVHEDSNYIAAIEAVDEYIYMIIEEEGGWDSCHACHLAYPDSFGGEFIWEITNSLGGSEFCGQELMDAESSTYYFTVGLGDSLVSQDGGFTLYEGVYGPGAGSTPNSDFEVHCEEEHGDHRHLPEGYYEEQYKLVIYNTLTDTIENTFLLDSVQENAGFHDAISTYNRINKKMYVKTEDDDAQLIFSIDSLGQTQLVHIDSTGGIEFIEAHTNITPTIEACDSYSWNGSVYTSSGTHTWVGTNSAGCDSVATLNLVIKTSTTSSQTQTACDSYNWNGVTYIESGNYTWSGTNSVGCDSTATLVLTINNSKESTDVQAHCNSYTWINGVTYEETPTHPAPTYLLQTQQGCDSLITLSLTINIATTSNQNNTSCDSYDWNGQTYTESGTYTWSGTNVLGCDSIATLNLSIKNSTSSNQTHTACDSYDWNGQTYTESGAYTWTETNSNGCDSVATLDLTINNTTSSNHTGTACYSYDWNGKTYTESGTYTWSGTNVLGCDSIATLMLNISNISSSINQSGDSLYATVNPTDPNSNTNWYNVQTENDVQRIWLMKENSPTFMPTFDCSYFIVVENSEGCVDTSETYYYGASALRIETLQSYPNPTQGKTRLEFINENNQYVLLQLLSNNGEVLENFLTKKNHIDIDLSQYPSGTYYINFDSTNSPQGCDGKEIQQISKKIILNK